MAKDRILTKKQLEDRAADLENKCKRAVADYLNLEKRLEKEKELFIKLANAQLLDKILPILDDLETCQKHLKDKGLELVLSKFRQLLASEGVEEIKAADQEFDPKMMDATEIARGPKNKVAEVISKGYKIEDRVLRPAKVRVGQGNNEEK